MHIFSEYTCRTKCSFPIRMLAAILNFDFDLKSSKRCKQWIPHIRKPLKWDITLYMVGKSVKINVFIINDIATGGHLGFSLDLDIRSSKGCQKWIPCMRKPIKRYIAHTKVVRISKSRFSKWLLAAILDFWFRPG